MVTGNHGSNSHSKNHHKKHDRPHSRPHSRNQRHHRKSSRDSRLRHSSRTRGSSRHRSISSDEEEDVDLHQEEVDSDAAAVINDDMTDEDSEDFFTGESDNDFVSLSSGSNSKARAPRKSWTCEHCTYVNNPGVAVCVVCCRTSKQSRGEEFERSASRSSHHHQRNKKKAAAAASKWTKYDTSEEDDSLRRSVSRQSAHENHLKRNKGSRNHKKKAKSPMPEYNVSDLDEDAINEYYAVRHMSSDKRYESSSETGSSMHHNPPTRKPNLDAPAPAKGILKKSNSNPHLTKLELDAKVGSVKNGPPSHVVDIKKYLAQTQNNPHLNHDTKSETGAWQEEKSNWMTSAHSGVQTDSDGESVSSTTNNIGRLPPPSSMTRSLSGHSLGDLEYLQQQYDQQQHQHGKFPSRKTSEAGMVSGKKNFRSKRFSRNLEREPAIRRAQSLHMDRRTMEENDGFLETHRGVLRKSSMGGKPSSSGSSGQEDTLHFTATVEGQEVTGSYLARQEFGGTAEAGLAAVGDSGYISHSSGGGGPNTSYTKPSNLRVST